MKQTPEGYELSLEGCHGAEGTLTADRIRIEIKPGLPTDSQYGELAPSGSGISLDELISQVRIAAAQPCLADLARMTRPRANALSATLAAWCFWVGLSRMPLRESNLGPWFPDPVSRKPGDKAGNRYACFRRSGTLRSGRRPKCDLVVDLPVRYDRLKKLTSSYPDPASN